MSNSMISTKCLSLGAVFIFAFLSGSDARAATRTIQFSGSAVNYYEKLLPSNYSLYYGCVIMITNTGSQTERVLNVKFNIFDSSKALSTVGPTTDLVFKPTDTTATAVAGGCSATTGTCSTPVEISSGGFYIASTQLRPVMVQGIRVAHCAGSFQVDDKTSTTPGSLTANGAISYLGEFGFVGGQLNGALYVSGTHANSANSSVQPPASSPAAPGTAGWTSSMQMNLFCSQACSIWMGGSADVHFCNAVCGMETAYSDSTLTKGAGDSSSALGANNPESYRNSFGYLEEADPTNPTSYSPGATPSPLPFHDNTKASVGVSPLSMFRGLVRTANPHFAGGYVMEMIVGPFDSICSGNSTYFNNSNTDFQHLDTLDHDAAMVYSSSVSGKSAYPPERLYCSHVHGKHSAFGYLTQGSQFTINGGMAF